MAAATVVPPGNKVQPDIAYAPDFAKYKARVERRLAAEKLDTSVPEGFPAKLDSELVWEGKDLEGTDKWVYELSENEIQEIEAALQHYKSLEKPLGHVNQETFPLPNLHQRLRTISKDLHSGRGFAVLRGLPVDIHTRVENIIIYAGVSSHIAPLLGRQDNKFEGKPASVVLGHIKDLSNTSQKGQIGAPAYTSDKQVFHTDSGDIVSLLALSTAAEGGQSKLASSWRVYNELAENRPDIIHTLSEPWIADRQAPAKEKFSYKEDSLNKYDSSFDGKSFSRPLLHHQPSTLTNPERIIIQYARRYFTGFHALPRSKEIPPITEAQAEALDAIHFLAEQFAIGLNFRKGDVQYINNLSIFHARDAFTDTPNQQRHLVRLWLRDPENAWETPAPLASRWSGLYDGVTPENTIFPLEPHIRSESDGNANKATQASS